MRLLAVRQPESLIQTHHLLIDTGYEPLPRSPYQDLCCWNTILEAKGVDHTITRAMSRPTY